MRALSFGIRGAACGAIVAVLGRMLSDHLGGFDPGYDYWGGLLAIPGAVVGFIVGLLLSAWTSGRRPVR